MNNKCTKDLNTCNHPFCNFPRCLEEVSMIPSDIQVGEPPFIYVASPHLHNDKERMQSRYEKACLYTAQLIELGNIAFSPIAHSHHMAGFLGPESFCFQYWEKVDYFFLERADIVHVLCIEGWLDSEGIQKEVQRASELDKPVVYIPCEV